jgi:hypothetical protein
MRIETQGGNYTNYPGETKGVFDVTVAAVVYEPDRLVTGVSNGRPTLASDKGAVIVLKEYDYNIHGYPDDYWVEPVEKGIYTDNPTELSQITEQVIELLSADGYGRVASVYWSQAVTWCY